MFPRLWKFLQIAVVLSLLTSCGAFEPAPATRAPLRVEFSSWWGDYTLIIAKERGLFEKYGVDVEPVYYDVYYKSLADLSAGQLDGALMNIGDALNTSRHANIVIPAVYDDGGPNTVVASPDITRVPDLKGKRIGVPIGSTYELFVVQMLETGGLKLSDVSLFDYDPADVPAALGVDIDAGFSWEPYTGEALSKGNRILFKSNETSMLFPDVIVFRREVVESQPDQIRAFLRAWFEAVEFRRQNPQAARQIIAEYLKVPQDTIEFNSPVTLFNRENNLDLYRVGADGGASPIQQIASINTDFLVRVGTLTSNPDFNAMLDESYLR